MPQSKKFNLKVTVFLIVTLLLVTFAFFNSRIFIQGPQITVFEPQDGSAFEDPFIEIKGQVKNVSLIELDDNPIFIDESGNFNEKLLLSPGISIIKLYARDKFNREETKFLKYIYSGKAVERKIIPENSTTTEENSEETESVEILE